MNFESPEMFHSVSVGLCPITRHDPAAANKLTTCVTPIICGGRPLQRRRSPDVAGTRLADPRAEDWPTVSPRDAAAVTPLEPK